MLQASNASSKLRELNNDTLCIDNVFFELLLVDNLDGHFGQLQRMDKKYNEHSWCKVKGNEHQ